MESENCTCVSAVRVWAGGCWVVAATGLRGLHGAAAAAERPQRRQPVDGHRRRHVRRRLLRLLRLLVPEQVHARHGELQKLQFLQKQSSISPSCDNFNIKKLNISLKTVLI